MKARVVILALAIAVSGGSFFAAISGCFSEPKPDCAFLCGLEGQCPSGYFCATDGACKREGLLDGFDCGFRAPADAAVPADAAPDAPVDAAIDAAIDEAVDAAIDAM